MANASLPPAVQELYPWNGRYLALESGPRMHYLDVGTGETLLFLHGNPTWSFYWRNLIHEYSSRYRCIAPDHVGMGLSDKPQEYKYQLEQHVENMVQLITALDLHDITLVVHDWGGPIGYATALRLPERFRRFVVFNTMSRMGNFPPSIRYLRIPMLGPAFVRGWNGFVKYALSKGTSKPKTLRGPIADGYKAPYNSWANRVAIQAFVDDIPLEDDHPTKGFGEALQRQLPDLGEHPHLIIWGDQDFVFHHYFRDCWIEDMPEAEVHVLPDANHLVVEDATTQIIPLMTDFLDRHPLKAGE